MREKVAAFVSNPWVGLTGIIIGVVSLLLSVYFYWAAERAPLLEYAVYPFRSTVVAANPISDLEVSYRGTKVVGAVSILQMIFGNAGNSPVRHDDILSPIKINLAKGTRILEATTMHARPETQFTLNPANFHEGSVGLDWKILEGGDGAIVQITYAGGLETEIAVEGSVVDQRIISKGYIREAGSRSSSYLNLILALLMMLFFIASAVLTWRGGLRSFMDKVRFILSLAFLIGLLYITQQGLSLLTLRDLDAAAAFSVRQVGR